MIHTYNYSGHNYYQTPGKPVQNASRSVPGYTNYRTYSSSNTSNNNATSLNRSTSGQTVASANGASATTVGSSVASLTRPSAANSSHDAQQRSLPASASATASLTISTTGLDGSGGGDGLSVSSPSSGPPSSASFDQPKALTAPIVLPTTSQQNSSHFNGHFYGHGHGITQYNTQPVSLHVRVPAENEEPVTPTNPYHKPRKSQPQVGRLTMSRAKLTSPSVNSLSSSESETLSHQTETHSPPTSPHPGSGNSSAIHEQPLSPSRTLTMTTASSSATASAASSPPPLTAKSKYRPSTTISSLRVLLSNHPHGMSLVESLEEEDEEEDSCSETETNDSEEDSRARLQELQLQQESTVERPRRRRPPPEFEWMNARRRFSSSSLSTISREIRDSQKGQHALWKYIGGGNFHAHIRYDIGRILDSGCGLGEWTMEMAKEFPNATVYGIDINPELFPDVNQNVPSNCLFTQSDLLTRLSFPDQYFDFVYQRFLYLGLTVDDWPVALKELHRVMKPGAWIELFEPCMRMHRAGPRTRQVLRWISRLLQENRGLDFDFAGEKMRRLCESPQIGFVNVRVERLSIPVGAWGGRVGEAMAENLVLMFQNLKAAISTMAVPPSVPAAADSSSSSSNSNTTASTPTSASASSTPTNNSIPPLDDSVWQNSFDTMVQSWVRECETNKSYFDYYILVGQRAP
ncbi:hypothetical protein BGZ73_001283 [Actinomortierella ambigua]|nr:hypothetical protein BGZ73_001283 [Actinomortierella ambigua]